MPYSIRTAIPPGTTSGPELADIVEEVGDLTQIVVLSDTTNQPGSPTEGDAYIVNGDVSWGGAQYDIAVFRDTTWIYHTPGEGWVAYIKDRGEARRFNGTDWNTRIPDSSPEHATDGGTDAYASATNTDAPKDGDKITRDFQSANTTTTPELDSLTITTKDGSALWAGALSGVHELQYASSGPAWRVLDPNPNGGDEPASVAYVDEGDPVLKTVVDATNGGADDLSEIDFTSIKSDAVRVTLLFEGLSLSGSDDIYFQIGDSGGVETSGYRGKTTFQGGSNVDSWSGGVNLNGGSSSSDAFTIDGRVTIELLAPSDNTWIISYMAARADENQVHYGSGRKTLSETLDRIRLAPSGTDTFGGGNINILVE